MMLTHCGNNVRNRYSGCVFSVKDIVPVPLKTSRNPVAQPNDLILRDLGYFVLDVFKQLDQRGCFFVSRLKTGTCLLARESDEELDILKLLRGQELVDMPVRVGKKDKLAVRLIAVKLPQNAAASIDKTATIDFDTPGVPPPFWVGKSSLPTSIRKTFLLSRF